jgi:DNA-binding IclR family transcriptional regulator
MSIASRATAWYKFSSYIGMHWPAHISAVGKALLAFLPDTDLRRTLQQMNLHKVTPRTITSRRALHTQLLSFRRIGYTWEMEEGEKGVACVAAPLFGPQGEVVAAVSVTGTIQQIPKNRIATTGAMVKKYAHLMSSRLAGES